MSAVFLEGRLSRFNCCLIAGIIRILNYNTPRLDKNVKCKYKKNESILLEIATLTLK